MIRILFITVFIACNILPSMGIAQVRCSSVESKILSLSKAIVRLEMKFQRYAYDREKARLERDKALERLDRRLDLYRLQYGVNGGLSCFFNPIRCIQLGERITRLEFQTSDQKARVRDRYELKILQIESREQDTEFDIQATEDEIDYWEDLREECV